MRSKKNKKKFLLPLKSKLFSAYIAIFVVICLTIIVLLFIYQKNEVNKEIASPNSLKTSLEPASSQSPYPTVIHRPAEQCVVTSTSDTLDTYNCTHFIIQLPKGWYGSYVEGVDTSFDSLLSSTEFYNYDYTKVSGSSFDPKRDNGKQKIYLTLYLSNKSEQAFVDDYENLLKKDFKQATFTVTPITKNNYSGLKVHTIGTPYAPNTFYVIQNPSKTITLKFGNIFGIDGSLLEEIFSTIKFNDSKEDWASYTSSNYSFKYPIKDGWIIHEFSNPPSVRLSCNNNCKNASFVWFTIEPVVYKSVEEYKASGTYSYLTETQSIALNGDPAIRGVFPGGPPGGLAQIIYFVAHKGAGYFITYHYSIINKSKFSDYPPPNPDILSTFNFLN